MSRLNITKCLADSASGDVRSVQGLACIPMQAGSQRKEKGCTSDSSIQERKKKKETDKQFPRSLQGLPASQGVSCTASNLSQCGLSS